MHNWNKNIPEGFFLSKFISTLHVSTYMFKTLSIENYYYYFLALQLPTKHIENLLKIQPTYKKSVSRGNLAIPNCLFWGYKPWHSGKGNRHMLKRSWFKILLYTGWMLATIYIEKNSHKGIQMGHTKIYYLNCYFVLLESIVSTKCVFLDKSSCLNLIPLTHWSHYPWSH